MISYYKIQEHLLNRRTTKSVTTSLVILERILFLTLIVFVLAVCVHNKLASANDSPQIATLTKPDCSPSKQPYSLREYTVLGARVMGVNPIIVGADARDLAATAFRELDSMDRQVDTWKARAGEGEYGKEVADKYLWVKNLIVEKRKEIEEKLVRVIDREKALEVEKVNFENWRSKNKKHLIRHVDDMKLEIIWIGKHNVFGNSVLNTEIFIEATNTTSTKILKPKNQKIWGYESGSDIGGQISIGASLTDSFGNDYKLTSVTPSFLGNEGNDIRPGQTVTFKVRFGDAPLPNSRSVQLVIDPVTFGQSSAAIFDIPIEAFY